MLIVGRPSKTHKDSTGLKGLNPFSPIAFSYRTKAHIAE